MFISGMDETQLAHIEVEEFEALRAMGVNHIRISEINEHYNK